MSEASGFAVAVMYASPLPAGISTLLAALETRGVTLVATERERRVSIATAIERRELFAQVETLLLETDRGWTGHAALAPYTAVTAVWPASSGGTAASIAALCEQLLALGEVEFAAWDHVERTAGPFRPRTALLAQFHADVYASHGPLALGAFTVLGDRLLALFEPATREALTRAGRRTSSGLAVGGAQWLDTAEGRDQRAALATVFEQSGVVSSFGHDRHGIPEGKARPRWHPPSAGPPPARPSRAAATAVKKLRNDGHDLELAELVAPFSELGRIEVTDVDLKASTLLMSSFASSVLTDVGAVGADLRGIDARDSEWIESTLDEADLRWANFTGARFPATSLDRVSSAYATFTDAEALERAEGACFDHAIALRWKPDADNYRANMTRATFRHADLREAEFRGTVLEGAVFDGADLRGATFTAADLRGASFRGADLTGTQFSDCRLDGAYFDPRSP